MASACETDRDTDRTPSLISGRCIRFLVLVLIGLSEQDVARRLGISAEMVRQIMNHRMKDERRIDSDRGLTDVGMDEISLKKRHQLYATVLTDLKNLEQPRTLTVAWGRDQTAGHPAVEGSLPRGEEAWCGRRSREKKKSACTKRACLRRTQRPSTSQMWAFRKRLQDLSDKGQIKLSQLFDRIPDRKLPDNSKICVSR